MNNEENTYLKVTVVQFHGTWQMMVQDGERNCERGTDLEEKIDLILNILSRGNCKIMPWRSLRFLASGSAVPATPHAGDNQTAPNENDVHKITGRHLTLKGRTEKEVTHLNVQEGR